MAKLVNDEKKAARDPSKLNVTPAIDGSFGRSVWWGTQLVGCRAEIYIHKNVSRTLETAVAQYGANVTQVNGNYEASLAACRADAAAHGWHSISNKSWDGYHDIPLLIVAGYTLIGREVIDQLSAVTLTFCSLPIGVYGIARGVVAPFWQHMNENFHQ